ncbi:hypothetical protein HHK36_016592 [Tetracentron sinense]|uniref:Protein kinase domain-containing protein n=1 Tax=Tetracentron sinense TaxID=13715 RepID=A0A834Z5K3_TETSI|nr:hypothetical protein HHK36_016592 [Tetracentron sinense]
MFSKSYSIARVTEMGCCSCFGFIRRPKRSVKHISGSGNRVSQEFLLNDNLEHLDGDLYNGDPNCILRGDGELRSRAKRSEEILMLRAQKGLICRDVLVKETRKVILSEDDNGNKMVNEYVRECKIGSGSYGKVVLYRSNVDGKHYAIKAFHKSHLLKLRVAPSETAMTDVLREVWRNVVGRFVGSHRKLSTFFAMQVSIMKILNHPNIVNLIEVIDDPNMDHFYMVLEYVEGKWVWESSGPTSGLGESTARKYLRDIVAGLMYLHAHTIERENELIDSIFSGSSDSDSLVVVVVALLLGQVAFTPDLMNIVHGDIKPDNLLISSTGTVKIGDFSVSQVFEDDNDVLRRSPGTPVFTAPECCLGLTYHGKAADTWALGVTLYCMVLGRYPFLGDTLQDTYDKIVNNSLSLPEGINPQLKNLLEGLLCKDPKQRMTLGAVAEYPWVVEEEGPIPQYLCWCKSNSFEMEESDGSGIPQITSTD